MECRPFIDGMLVGEPRELRGVGDTPLARHIRSCASCRSAAQAILHGEAELGRAMEAWSTAPVAAQRRAGGRASDQRVPTGVLRRPSWAGVARAALPAAAVIALALLAGDGVRSRLDRPDRTAAPNAAEPVAESESPLPVIDVEPGQNAVVFNTSNPGITVVWYYTMEGTR
ncbi:MAG: hypothetical protein L0271_17870 [Gemmatimonadetes bacterium]|nr:hypothetical protein [Gemmatimonadota bacterium]